MICFSDPLEAAGEVVGPRAGVAEGERRGGGLVEAAIRGDAHEQQVGEGMVR